MSRFLSNPKNGHPHGQILQTYFSKYLFDKLINIVFKKYFAVVNQLYETEILNEYVIRGNAAVLKCSIPSFVADFVYVVSWVDSNGTTYKPAVAKNDNYGKTRNPFLKSLFLFSETFFYERSYIPKRYLHLWFPNPDLFAGQIHIQFSYSLLFYFTVVSQNYVTEAENEYIIRGNSAAMKCKIPSFVADFVYVESWVSSDGSELKASSQDFGKIPSSLMLNSPIPFCGQRWNDQNKKNIKDN